VWSFRVTLHNLVDTSQLELYTEGKGWPSVPPSQWALILLLQTRERLSDLESIDLTCFDLKRRRLWREAGTPLCAKSTLQIFRSHLIFHDNLVMLIRSSLNAARRKGLLKGQHLWSAVDTKPMLLQSQGARNGRHSSASTSWKH